MRSMMNEVSWCIYVIDRVHCALRCLYIVDLIVFYSALRAHVRCRSLKLVLNWANCLPSPNVLRTVRRTILRFLIELLVRQTWFGQLDELYTSFLTGL